MAGTEASISPGEIMPHSRQSKGSVPSGSGRPLNAHAVSMDDLVCYIENWTDLPPVNHTEAVKSFRTFLSHLEHSSACLPQIKKAQNAVLRLQ
jgi:hypothetical protein